MCSIGTLAVGYIVVVVGLVVGLKIFGWIVDGLIAFGTAAAPSQFGIKCDIGFSLRTLLGGDDDDTVGTACSVECVACGIFEYGDAGYIVRVDTVPQTIVGYAVEYDKWVVAGVERADTADTEFGIGVGRTGGRERLQTGDVALKSIHHVVYLSFFDGFAVYDTGRTRKRGFFLFSVCHDDDFIE